MNICVNCKHHVELYRVALEDNEDFCRRTAIAKSDPVKGGTNYFGLLICRNQREHCGPNFCEPEGKFFSPKGS